MDWNNNRNTLILAFILLALGAVGLPGIERLCGAVPARPLVSRAPV
jgi:hypothetical protein